MDITKSLEATARNHRANVEVIRAKMELMSATTELARTPLWTAYKKGLQKLIDSKIRRMITCDDVSTDEVVVPIEYKDRERAILCAEVRLLDQVMSAPARFAVELPLMRKEIDNLEAAADDIDAKFGVSTKGA